MDEILEEVLEEEPEKEPEKEEPKKKRGRKPKSEPLEFFDKISFDIDEKSFKEELKKNLLESGIKSYPDAHKNIQRLRSVLMKTLASFGLDVNRLLIALKEAEQK